MTQESKRGPSSCFIRRRGTAGKIVDREHPQPFWSVTFSFLLGTVKNQGSLTSLVAQTSAAEGSLRPELEEIEKLSRILAEEARAGSEEDIGIQEQAVKDALSRFSAAALADSAFGRLERPFLQLEAAMLRAKAKIWRVRHA